MINCSDPQAEEYGYNEDGGHYHYFPNGGGYGGPVEHCPGEHGPYGMNTNMRIAALEARVGTLEAAFDPNGLVMRTEARVKALERFAQFFKKVFESWVDAPGDIDGGDVQDWGEKFGIMEPVLYDPEKHGEVDAVQGEDTIYVLTADAKRVLDALAPQPERKP